LRAMLLSAGLGTRLRPLTYKVAKPMIPVVNRPSISYPLNSLKKTGVREVVINLYHQAWQVKEYLGKGEKFNIVELLYSEEKHLLGTAGGLKKVEAYFKDTFLVLSADGITSFDLSKAVQFHRQKKALATVILKGVGERFKYGVVQRDEEGRITQFIEKPDWGDAFSNKVNTGIYIFEPEIFSYIPSRQPYDFGHQVLPFLARERKKVYGYLMDDYWADIGNLQDYRRVQKDILEGETGTQISGKQRRKGVWIGEDSEVSESAILEPPVVIGNNCRIEAKVKIGKYTTLGHRVTVKKEACLKSCILWNDVLVGEKVHLDDCILGHFTCIPSGFSMSKGVVVEKKGESR